MSGTGEGHRGIRWRWVLGGLLALYGAGVGAMALGQRHLLYFPTRATLDELTRGARGVGLEPWRTADGKVIGWRRPAPPAEPGTAGVLGTVLVVHGNAGYAAHRAVYADVLQRAAPLEVCILEYPGYGFRDGEVGEAAFFAAADEAVRAVEPGRPLYVLGESLGTGVACYLAGAHADRISGLLLVAPYDRLARVAGDHFPWVPVNWILRDRFDSVEHLGRYRGPVAIWVGGDDRVVPARFGKALHAAYGGPKRLREALGAGHEDVFREGASWWRDVVEFWRAGAK